MLVWMAAMVKWNSLGCGAYTTRTGDYAIFSLCVYPHRLDARILGPF